MLKSIYKDISDYGSSFHLFFLSNLWIFYVLMMSIDLKFAGKLLHDLCFIVWLGELVMWSHATFSSSMQRDKKVYT